MTAGTAMAKDKSDSTPAPARQAGEPAAASARPDIEAFIARARTLASSVEAGRRGRLIFALDATMSRQPTWDIACQLQAEMFREAAAIGGLEIQLVYYRGFKECRATDWIADGARLASLMTGITCQGGQTQIGKILAHARRETEKAKAQALVFVGDAMEEGIDDLAAAAGELGLRGVPAFVFQEGDDPVAERAFREIARLSHGAYCRFDVGAAHQLRELLRAAAAYAAGGMRALSDLSARQGRGAMALLQQMK
ncbi:MAG TPA: VWA domain-containing protein [Xanthobacteraceae bacterium]|nr:VWA domain-containing protein [Xanthobacteraceae bacterium]